MTKRDSAHRPISERRIQALLVQMMLKSAKESLIRRRWKEAVDYVHCVQSLYPRNKKARKLLDEIRYRELTRTGRNTV